jgi:hypothetical protein
MERKREKKVTRFSFVSVASFVDLFLKGRWGRRMKTNKKGKKEKKGM